MRIIILLIFCIWSVYLGAYIQRANTPPPMRTVIIQADCYIDGVDDAEHKLKRLTIEDVRELIK